MARFVYTKDMISFLEKGYQHMRVPALTDAFNKKFDLDKSEKAIKSTLKNRNITCGRKPGFLKGEKSQLLTPEQIKFVEKQYKKLSRRELIDELNAKFDLELKLSQLVSFVKNHKINSGRSGQFIKGVASWNKGKKGYMGPNKTSFKKGSVPRNKKPIGHERICNKDGYVLVKVAERSPFKSSDSGWYRHKHVVLWEEHNGPVPEGSCVRFKDGNRMNITIENLILVSRAVHARLTIAKYGEMPDEVKPAMVAIAELEQSIFEKTQAV